jgi:hypothetical protein
MWRGSVFSSAALELNTTAIITGGKYSNFQNIEERE